MGFFRPRSSIDSEYVNIKLGDSCKASIGRNNGNDKYLILDSNHCTDRDIFHELLHVIGLLHEHQRPDRNDYVVFNDSNIAYNPSRRIMYQNFRMFKRNVDIMDLPYDGTSIMHYRYLQGSITDFPTLTSTVNYEQYLVFYSIIYICATSK